MLACGLHHHAFGDGKAHGGFNLAQLQRLQLRLAFGAPVQIAIDRLTQNGQRAVAQFLRRHDAIDQANFQRLLGTDIFPGGNDLQRAVSAEQTRHAYRTAKARHNPQLGFRQANAQVRRRQAIVSGQHTLAAAAQRIAVNGRDRRNRQIFQAVKHAVSEVQPLAKLLLGNLEQREEFGDVRADNKGGFVGAQQQPGEVGAFFQHVQRLAETRHRRRIELVDRAGGREHQFSNAIFQPVEVQGIAFVEHVSLLNPAGLLVLPDETECGYYVNKMQMRV